MANRISELMIEKTKKQLIIIKDNPNLSEWVLKRVAKISGNSLRVLKRIGVINQNYEWLGGEITNELARKVILNRREQYNDALNRKVKEQTKKVAQTDTEPNQNEINNNQFLFFKVLERLAINHPNNSLPYDNDLFKLFGIEIEFIKYLCDVLFFIKDKDKIRMNTDNVKKINITTLNDLRSSYKKKKSDTGEIDKWLNALKNNPDKYFEIKSIIER